MSFGGLAVIVGLTTQLLTAPTDEVEAKEQTQTYEITWYTAGYESTGKTPSHPAYGITASGRKVVEGKTAACPPSMPFGTRLRIEGVGERRCDDRGSLITEGHIDVYIEDVEQALRNGRVERKVEILN